MTYQAGEVPAVRNLERTRHDDGQRPGDADEHDHAHRSRDVAAGHPGRLLLDGGATVVLRAGSEAGVLRADPVPVVMRLPLTGVRWA